MTLLAFSILVLSAVATAYCVTTGLDKLRGPSGKLRRVRFIVDDPNEDNIPKKDEKVEKE